MATYKSKEPRPGLLVRLETCQECGELKQSTELKYIPQGLTLRRLCSKCYTYLNGTTYNRRRTLSR